MQLSLPLTSRSWQRYDPPRYIDNGVHVYVREAKPSIRLMREREREK